MSAIVTKIKILYNFIMIIVSILAVTFSIITFIVLAWPNKENEIES